MKKVLALLAAAGLMAAASAAFGASIVNSKHDLSNGATNTNYAGDTTQICIYCHAPHVANVSLPLWNRSNPDGANFTLYSGVNMASVSFKTGFTSDSTSLFCMSCHDGVTGLGQVFNAGVLEGLPQLNAGLPHAAKNATVFAAGTISSSGNLTEDLSKTHPVNFVVTGTDSQSDLWIGPTTTGPLMGKTNFTMPLFKSTHADANRTTTSRSLECGSCHAVHDSQYSPFLRYTMAKSALCLGCHNK